MENWNSANTVLHYGKDGALTGPDRDHAETSMLSLHLLQSALVHVNTLLVQQILAEPAWTKKLTDEVRRGATTARPGAASCRAPPPRAGRHRRPATKGYAVRYSP
ncbi:Tn3 family transposase [Streptomyces bobili]|uniref:Tn3 family transposase n=1 Tax=Streptomyces bobili TaxID=67280 RepID=UPI0036FF74B6